MKKLKLTSIEALIAIFQAMNERVDNVEADLDILNGDATVEGSLLKLEADVKVYLDSRIAEIDLSQAEVNADNIATLNGDVTVAGSVDSVIAEQFDLLDAKLRAKLGGLYGRIAANIEAIKDISCASKIVKREVAGNPNELPPKYLYSITDLPDTLPPVFNCYVVSPNNISINAGDSVGEFGQVLRNGGTDDAWSFRNDNAEDLELSAGKVYEATIDGKALVIGDEVEVAYKKLIIESGYRDEDGVIVRTERVLPLSGLVDDNAILMYQFTENTLVNTASNDLQLVTSVVGAPDRNVTVKSTVSSNYKVGDVVPMRPSRILGELELTLDETYATGIIYDDTVATTAAASYVVTEDIAPETRQLPAYETVMVPVWDGESTRDEITVETAIGSEVAFNFLDNQLFVTDNPVVLGFLNGGNEVTLTNKSEKEFTPSVGLGYKVLKVSDTAYEIADLDPLNSNDTLAYISDSARVDHGHFGDANFRLKLVANGDGATVNTGKFVTYKGEHVEIVIDNPVDAVAGEEVQLVITNRVVPTDGLLHTTTVIDNYIMGGAPALKTYFGIHITEDTVIPEGKTFFEDDDCVYTGAEFTVPHTDYPGTDQTLVIFYINSDKSIDYIGCSINECPETSVSLLLNRLLDGAGELYNTIVKLGDLTDEEIAEVQNLVEVEGNNNIFITDLIKELETTLQELSDDIDAEFVKMRNDTTAETDSAFAALLETHKGLFFQIDNLFSEIADDSDKQDTARENLGGISEASLLELIQDSSRDWIIENLTVIDGVITLSHTNVSTRHIKHFHINVLPNLYDTLTIVAGSNNGEFVINDIAPNDLDGSIVEARYIKPKS